MKKLLLFLSFVICALCCTESVLALNKETINFVRLNVNDGLSNNEVNCILKDRTGFMWFGTSSGLNRYDGHQFRVVRNTAQNSAVSEANVKKIVETADSCLWLHYFDEQLDVYDMQAGEFVSALEKLQSYGITDTIETFYMDQKYDLICKNNKNQILRYKFIDNSVTRFNAYTYGVDKNDQVANLYAFQDRYYLIYNSGRIIVTNSGMDQILAIDSYLCDKPGNLYRLYVDDDGDIWAIPDPGFKLGLYYRASHQNRWTQVSTRSDKWRLSNDIIHDVIQDAQGRVWIATDHGGINLIDKKKNQPRYLKSSSFDTKSISQNSIISLYRDDTDIIWAGTYKNGINYYHESIFKFDHLKYIGLESDEQASNDCACVYEDPQGRLWIGTNGGGLFCYDYTTGKYKIYKHDPEDKNSICGDIVISINSDKEGNLWLGTFLNGMDKFDGKKFTHYTVESTNGQLSNNSVYAILNDSRGKIWIGTLGGGLNCYDPVTGEWQHYRNHSATHPLTSDYISCLIEIDDKKIAVGTSYGVTFIDNETGEVELLYGNRSGSQELNTSIVNSLLWDSRKLLWMATNSGLNMYDESRDSLYVLNEMTGLSDNKTVSLLEDAEGNVWVGSRNGLSQVCVQKGGGEYSFTVRAFDADEGLQGRDFNIHSIYKTRQEELIFGGTNGLTIIDIDKIKYNTNPPDIVLTDFWVNNRPVFPGTEVNGRILIEKEICYERQINLNYSERNISMEFSGLNYFLPEKTTYEYKMQGFDNDWLPVEETKRRIQYTNLSPGKYTFMVKAANNDGVSSGEVPVIEILIKPPFYRTYWAVLVYFILLAVLLYLILTFLSHRQQKIYREKEERAAIRQLHEIDEMKLRFFTNVSHEFRTPLTLILNPLERLLKNIKDPEHTTLIRLIYQNANQLLTLVNQLLDFRKIDMQGHVLTLSVGDIIPFVRDIIYSFKDLAERKKIRFSFHAGFDSLNMKFDKDKVYKIIVNLLSNAFKFTPEGGEIKLHLSIRSSLDAKDQLVIQIMDTGIGIEKKDQEHIFERFYQSIDPENDHSGQGTGIGLHLCKEFVKLHNGEITVTSEKGKGSIFTVTLPVLKAEVNHEIVLSHDASSMEEASSLILYEEFETELSESSVSDGTLPTLLIIDDNTDFRNFMALSLRDQYNVLQASDGDSGWNMVMEEIPDLVICDVMMPGINGLELCRRIKNDIQTSHIPVILLTAKSAEDSKLKGLEAGADDYIGKPFNMDMLLIKIKRVMELRAQIQSRIIQFSQNGIRLADVNINSLDEELIKKAVNYIETHISDPQLSVEKISREMGMSRVSFYKKTLSMTGKTPVELIRLIRIKKAGKILEKTQMRVSEVMLEVGINDIKLFRKYFKEEFGVLPSDYQGNKKDSDVI